MDISAHPVNPRRLPAVRWASLLLFVLCFAALQAGWEWARGTWLERLWVHELTVRSATMVIQQLTPGAGATAQGTRIVAPGGGLNVMFGCEGTDVLFLLTAALLAFPMGWRHRALGLLWSLAVVFLLNQARIVALFYAYRHDRGLFETLHTTAAPLMVIAAAGLFFHAWLVRSQRLSAAPA